MRDELDGIGAEAAEHEARDEKRERRQTGQPYAGLEDEARLAAQ
jgi:hypothetical protein